jgi:glycosyltransferase involved in cell wall biosynthesis
VPPQLAELARRRPDHRWFAEGGPPVVLAAGRLVRQKRFDVLVRAFARVHEARPDARLVIIGGEHAAELGVREELEQLVTELGLSDVADLPGYVDNAYGWMAHAAVFAMTSEYEGFGLVLAEAMATGVPLVSADCPGGPPEILEHGRLGQLVPVGDDEALGAALLRALEEPGDRQERLRAAERYTFDACTEAYEAVLASVDGR